MEDSLDEKLMVGMLLDYYGSMLTEKQQNVMQLYCSEDYSLGEIAEVLQISRQGVLDCIKRAKTTLVHLEESLGVCRRQMALKSGLQSLLHAQAVQKDPKLLEQVSSLLSILEDE